MKELMKKPAFWIVLAIVLCGISYIGYLAYQYSKCKSGKDSPCKKSTDTSREGSSNIVALTPDEKISMMALADKTNGGTALSPADWTTLNGLVYRYVRTGGTDPVVHNDGTVKCSFWKGRTCS